MSLSNSTAAWERVRNTHTKFADWSVNSVRTVKFLGEDHLQLGISHRKTGQKANAYIDAHYNLVINEEDPNDAFRRVLIA